MNIHLKQRLESLYEGIVCGKFGPKKVRRILQHELNVAEDKLQETEATIYDKLGSAREHYAAMQWQSSDGMPE